MDNKAQLFRTATATIGCAFFDAGERVSVRYNYTDNNGTDWYYVPATARGPVDVPVVYPAHHLTSFCL